MLLTALEAAESGRTHREIAIAFWGAARVGREWDTNGWMHSRIKRLLRKARGTLKRYREIAAGN